MAAQDFLARPKMHYVWVNMLRADAEADDAGGDAAKEWKSGKQAGREWRLERFCLTQHTRDNPPLHHHLQPLRLESPD
jgi:hypothetical protein